MAADEEAMSKVQVRVQGFRAHVAMYMRMAVTYAT